MSFCVLIIVLLIPFLVAWSEEPSPSNDRSTNSPRDLSCGPVARGQRFFSKGHSFHSGFPPTLDAMAKSGAYWDSPVVGISFIGGSKVVQHVGGQKVQAALAAGAVDVLMTTPIYLPDPGIEQFAQFGAARNHDFRLTLMEFWLPFDQYEPRHYSSWPSDSPPERLEPPAAVGHNSATGEGLRRIHERYFAEMNEVATAVNKGLGRQVVFVVPVGRAVIALREKIIAGRAAGPKSQGDLFTDGLGHPKPVLTILMGYCHYAVVYRKSPIGLPAPKELGQAGHAGPLNRLLQELAWDAATNRPLTGVKADARRPHRSPPTFQTPAGADGGGGPGPG